MTLRADMFSASLAAFIGSQLGEQLAKKVKVQISTFFGRVTFWRTSVRRSGGSGLHPLDLALGLTVDGFSFLSSSHPTVSGSPTGSARKGRTSVEESTPSPRVLVLPRHS